MKIRSLFLPLLSAVLAGCSAAPVAPAPTAPVSTDTKPPPAATVPAATAGKSGPFEWPDAFEVNRRIGRGVNIGDALEAPVEGEWGIVLREEYFQLAGEAGFNAIRLPVRWNAHARETTP